MPSVAALYDIHGNLAALEAVLAEVPDDAAIVVGGDICAGGEQPSETLERLRGLGDRVRWVRGNSDRELSPGEAGLAPQEVVEAARSRLNEEEIAFLHQLPPTVRVGDVLYCHASPRNDVDIFTERTPEERIAFLFEGLDVATVVCGHTHTQYERTVAGVRVVNAGSVGMAYEEEPGAYWLLDLGHRRTLYDGAELTATREEAVAEFTERGL
ncbi:MAG TPA: metallophosphoesterase family protein [Gaiellaceae bacterium]|jgi:putative phosphoesterase|nr:metallophosphoesterase family protein [Gaiellaceae bacterium]